MFGYLKIVEQRIRDAQNKGEFENLPGAGKPLPLEDDRHIPEDLRMAYKILKNAGCVPPEIDLKKEIQQTRDLLENMEDTRAKYQTLKKLNYLITKLNILQSSPMDREMPQHYEQKLVERFGNKNKSR